ncbi:MAG: DUF1552 domain-containing protein [Myxococcaceae bacterium]
MSFKLSRRSLLTATSGFLGTLPLLEALAPRRALAAGETDPKRLVMIHFPNGTVTRQAKPTWFSATGALTTDNAPIPFQPFAGNLGDVTILKGLTQSARDKCYLNGGGGHGGSKPCFFTGQYPGSNSATGSTISGDSFDQAYAKTTPLGKSIYLANAEQGNGDGVEYAYELSHRDGQRVVPEINPVAFYNAYFKNLMGGPTVAPADGARNPKILASNMAAANRLKGKLGKHDKDRLDAYLGGMSDLQARLGTAPPVSTCMAPAMPSVNMGNTTQENLRGQSYFDRMKAFNQLIAVGFQCDLFRSVVISFGEEGNYTTYDGVYPATLNFNGAALTVQYDHSVSHQTPISNEGGLYTYDANMTRDRVHLSLVFDLVDRLKAVTDPSGSRVLDNTFVMAGFCVDDGQHGSDGGTTLGSPVIVCGGKNMASPGKSIDATAFDVNDLYFTFAQKFGMSLASWHPIAQTPRPWANPTGRMSGSTLVPL